MLGQIHVIWLAITSAGILGAWIFICAAYLRVLIRWLKGRDRKPPSDSA